eukprot:m.123142 g.123142  ORF g.123142 m.123142 type:complete len:277 (-) comp28965_c0_seq2:80-910(-)
MFVQTFQRSGKRLLHRLAFSGSLDLDTLRRDPLDEFRKRSHHRKLCDAEGRRLPGAPWGFQLAHASKTSEFPVLRTVGFQTVTANDFTFLLKRKPNTLDNLPIAITYVEGLYESGDVVEQWRAEGYAIAQSAEGILTTAPKMSLSNMLAVADINDTTTTTAKATATTTATATDDSNVDLDMDLDMNRDTSGSSMFTRGKMVDGEQFLTTAAKYKTALDSDNISDATISETVVVYKVVPTRVELLVGGPDFKMWERVQWLRRSTNHVWEAPQRILPY